MLAKAMLALVGLAATLFAAAYWYSLVVPGRAHQGPLPALTAQEAALVPLLRRHVTAVASVPHNTRHYHRLVEAARAIEGELRALGLDPVRQAYDAAGKEVWNIEATIEPATTPATSLVIGAHYDSAGDAPGANDNGTGVAALIEIARILKAGPPSRQRIRLVFFVNEEPPWFQTPEMGSRRYATLLRQRGERVSGMLSLETLGSFSDVAGSQKYPPPLGFLLPKVANFIAFVGMPASRPFLHQVIGAFRKHTKFPTLGGVAPAFIQGIDWSDHASFADDGIPALMITDTAVFRYPHYHRPTDTPDKIDYEKLARITVGLAHVATDLAK